MEDKLIRLYEELEVGPILYETEMNIIWNELEISSITPKEYLVNIRNQVVRYYSDRTGEAREAGDYDTFDRYNNSMSKIASSIDYFLYA